MHLGALHSCHEHIGSYWMELRGPSPPPSSHLHTHTLIPSFHSFPLILHHFPCVYSSTFPSSPLTLSPPHPSHSPLTLSPPPPTPRADSVTWNPHKSLNVPLQCSAILLQHNGVLQNCNSTRADYLFQQDKVNRVYRSIQEYTRVYKSIQEYTGSMQEYTNGIHKVYKSIQVNGFSSWLSKSVVYSCKTQ